MNKTIKEVVEQVLKEYPITRDDDFLLCIRVFIRMNFAHALPEGKIQIDLTQIDKAPAFETITRARREIQHNERRFLASPEVQMQRFRHEVRLHDYYSANSRASPKSRANTMPNSWMA